MVYKGHDSLDNTNYSVQFSIILYNLYEKWELVTFLLHAFTTITGIADSTSSFTVSIGFGFQQLFHYLHIPSPESVSLPFRRCIPFWYLLLIRLVLSCCLPLLYPDQHPFSGSSFILALSPPAPCGTGSVYHRLDLHCYYGFVRLLITHCFGFPIRLFLCYLFPFI